MNLIWSDEFVGPAGSLPNSTNWVTRLDGLSTAGQVQVLTADPVNCSLNGNGMLALTATKIPSPQGPIYKSAYVQSRQSWKYGHYEARIKIAKGQGLWPAFWMVGVADKTVPEELRTWPERGEADILELVGNKPNIAQAHIHGKNFIGPLIGKKFTLPDRDFSQDFHQFGMIWEPGVIVFMIDGVTFVKYTPADMKPGMVWPFEDQPMVIRLSHAVGGEWPGMPTPATVFPATMLVNWVRVYA